MTTGFGSARPSSFQLILDKCEGGMYDSITKAMKITSPRKSATGDVIHERCSISGTLFQTILEAESRYR